MNKSITKRKLWHYVNLKIKRAIHHYHVFSVISILFEELLIDFQNKKEVKIHNFGTFSLKTLKSKKYFDLFKLAVLDSTPKRILRFTLAPRIRKKILRHLDTPDKDE